MRPTARSFAETVAAEQQQIADGQPACGFRCDCHGGHTCVRVQHPDEPDNRVVHAAYTPDGTLVQWCGPHYTPDEQAAMRAALDAQIATQTAAQAADDRARVRAALMAMSLDDLHDLVAAIQARHDDQGGKP